MFSLGKKPPAAFEEEEGLLQTSTFPWHYLGVFPKNLVGWGKVCFAYFAKAVK